jgi:hypothetical protein
MTQFQGEPAGSESPAESARMGFSPRTGSNELATLSFDRFTRLDASWLLPHTVTYSYFKWWATPSHRGHAARGTTWIGTIGSDHRRWFLVLPRAEHKSRGEADGGFWDRLDDHSVT